MKSYRTAPYEQSNGYVVQAARLLSRIRAARLLSRIRGAGGSPARKFS